MRETRSGDAALGPWERYVARAVLTLIVLSVGCGRTTAPEAALDGSANTKVRGRGGEAGAKPVRLTADGPGDDSPAGETLGPLPEVVFHTSLGTIRVRLRSDLAPVTVDNFLNQYVARHYYDTTVFHHVERRFIVAAGGFDAEGQAKSTRPPIRNEAPQALKNRRGTLAMARDPDAPHSATCQVFFNLVDNSALDHQSDASAAQYGYCAFGEVIEGWDVVERMGEVDVQPRGEFSHYPTEPIVIERVDLPW